jgi:hypothetical protein
MSEEKNMSDFEKAQLRADREGKSILQIAIEDIEGKSSFSNSPFAVDTITLQNLMYIRKAMEEISIKERSVAFQNYYDELVHTIVELKRKQNL